MNRYQIIKDDFGNIYHCIDNGQDDESKSSSMVSFDYRTKKWQKGDKYLHREGGPAIEWFTGTKEWYFNGTLNREDGPAVEGIGGDKEWYLSNKCYGYDDDFTNESWKKFVKTLIFF